MYIQNYILAKRYFHISTYSNRKWSIKKKKKKKKKKFNKVESNVQM